MKHRRLKIRIFLTILAAMLPLGGCGKDPKTKTLDYQIKRVFGVDSETPTEMAAGAFDETDPDVRRVAIEKLSHKKWALREPYLKRFATLTNPKLEEDPSVRAVAVRTLGKAGDTKYHPQIIAALDDPSSVVRWDAAKVLDNLPTDKAVTKLQWLAIRKSEPLDVRAAAAKALRHYRTDPVYKTLLRCLDDENFTVRMAAHESLVYMTGRDRGFLPEKWAQSPDQIGKETLPEPVIRYKKRPWWDWMKTMKETEEVAAPGTEKKEKRAWWDWFGVKESNK